MYNHKEIEKKWQKYWKNNQTFKTLNRGIKHPKYYSLAMFPYPSATGLHVGHPESYTATDIMARYKRLNDYDVLHPMGWDAFGLPAEQYALQTGNHPATFTQQNINNFRKQLTSLGFSFDPLKEIDTTDPKYYKWTQWIFKALYKKGLAEIQEVDVNWCEELGTVLANEEVLTDKDGNKISERGNFPVVRKPMKQWVLKITEYADRLLEGLKDLEYPESLKNLQENWIGKSEGHILKFKIKNLNQDIEIFTTRIDTIFGATFLVIAPEHKIALELEKTNKEVKEYLNFVKTLNDRERIASKRKTGINTNLFAINPFTNEEIPIWIGDYVLNSYGTGAIMAVPGHDERDEQFAKEFNLKIKKVICPNNHLVNSKQFNHLNNEDAKAIFSKIIEEKNIGNKKITYKLRDWIFARQRYWGEPFPVYFDENDNVYLEEKLVELPHMDNIKPSKTGESPLANNKEWVYFEKNGKKYRRETNTMPQWAGSSWYFLAYILKNEDGSYLEIDSKEAFERFQKWMPVDIYIGGQEHAVGHLLYSRFWYKVLFDLNIVPNEEPFFKIINQGMILGPDGQKMSKSKGNVINPDDIVEQLGADTLRVYEMFMGPLVDTKAWNTDTINGIYKWLERIYRIFDKFINQKNNIDSTYEDNEFNSLWQETIRDVSKSIEDIKFNIAISKMMVFINGLYKVEKLNNKQPLVDFAIMLSCFAPHLAEELLFKMNEKPIHQQLWPKYDLNKIKKMAIKIAIQVNGKVRAIIEKEDNDSPESLIEKAKKIPNVAKYLENKTIKKEIYIKDKIITFNI